MSILRTTLCAAAIALAGTAAAAEKTIRVTLQLPITHPLGQNLECFKAGVEAASDIEVQIFPSAQLFKDNEVPQAVGSGAIEMGTASLTRFSGAVPAVGFFYLPFMLDTPEKVDAATSPDSPIRQALDAEILEKSGARILWWQAFGRTIYLTRGDKAIVVPEDAEGKKIRTFGKLLGWTAEAIGASPTLLSGSKQFLAYQQGAVDAGITGVTAVRSRKLYEVMDHMTLTYDADIEFVAVINEDFYQSLTDAERETITTVGRACEKQLRAEIAQLEAESIAEVADKINIVELTDEDRQKWRDATATVVERFVEEGGPLAAKVVDLSKDLN
ncbi:TRAP transporter substrate-binding protein DctP [Rhodobacteraceae bacterium NNCM2]|nr:TRAP transporter substrate-binding protein DctP [Coraliihabitans acroporae]